MFPHFWPAFVFFPYSGYAGQKTSHTLINVFSSLSRIRFKWYAGNSDCSSFLNIYHLAKTLSAVEDHALLWVFIEPFHMYSYTDLQIWYQFTRMNQYDRPRSYLCDFLLEVKLKCSARQIPFISMALFTSKRSVTRSKMPVAQKKYTSFFLADLAS